MTNQTVTLPYHCPVLESLNIPYQVPYDLISAGVESERIKYHAYEALGNTTKSDEALIKVLQGEKILSFMRSNALAFEKSNHIP